MIYYQLIVPFLFCWVFLKLNFSIYCYRPSHLIYKAFILSSSLCLFNCSSYSFYRKSFIVQLIDSCFFTNYSFQAFSLNDYSRYLQIYLPFDYINCYVSSFNRRIPYYNSDICYIFSLSFPYLMDSLACKSLISPSDICSWVFSLLFSICMLVALKSSLLASSFTLAMRILYSSLILYKSLLFSDLILANSQAQ